MYKNAKIQTNHVKEPHYSQIIVKIIIDIIIIIICTLCMSRRVIDYSFYIYLFDWGLKALASRPCSSFYLCLLLGSLSHDM